MNDSICIGIDVGSTTAKCVVVDTDNMAIIWSCYERHETRQAEKILELLQRIHHDLPQYSHQQIKAFITGSGAGPIKDAIGARFVQEVNAVALAVEKLHPDVNSVVELGGQDAKIILFKENPETGARQVVTSMNDKCASGTGATIDKCVLKVGMDKNQLSTLPFDDSKIHHVAAKCGVFAETDIVNLVKSGVPASEVLCSLADAIVMQNLSVLTRGNTLASKVLLLGGPNTYLPFLQQCWKKRIPETWQERGYQPASSSANDNTEELIIVPDNAEYYAAYGAVVFGMAEQASELDYCGTEKLAEFIQHGRKAKLGDSADAGLSKEEQELAEFKQQYQLPIFQAARFETGTTIRGYIGLDGGSTSSKAVLIDEQGELLCKQYQLSKGNPIQDTKELLAKIKHYASEQNCQLEVLGFGATGYAADVLEKSTRCDVNVVETVAHMMSAKAACGDDIDVICDIGGQDIKVLFLQHGQIKNFRLSNQCSAGNGMLLQAMADQFGVKVEQFSDVAFSAELSPKFSYGCAVFLDTDRVNFQKEGFSKEELFAGLARVLPKNVWQYVVQIPRMAELGRKFVLQGGTQYNLAAVKAQVDYIKERVPNAEVIVHPYCGEAGAMGAALEARRLVKRQGYSSFIGLDETINLEYSTRTDESTRCTFCENNCSRTFIDTQTPDGKTSRYIAGFSCEKGTVESKQAVVALNKERRKLKAEYPNLVDYEANMVFRRLPKDAAADDSQSLIKRPLSKKIISLFKSAKPENEQQRILEQRKKIRIGIPRVLNHYTNAPFMRAYLEALGVETRNIVFSDQTSEELWNEGGKYGAIDPCYPAKVSLAHVHHLLYKKHARKPLNAIWFPCITKIQSFTSEMEDSTTCPVVAGTPKVAAAAFTKEKNYFQLHNLEYIDNALDFTDRKLLAHQLFNSWQALLDVTPEESELACEKAWSAMATVDTELQRRGLQVLTEAEKNNSIVLLMLGRPYHNDPGLNHEILEEFQSLGYPVLSIRSIPKDVDYLSRFFHDDIEQGLIKDVFDITDVWPENYSVNSVQKVWAAKFAARHPNVAVLDLSSFKCGHDAPSYGIVDQIMSVSKTPYMAMHDIDANKPGGSIKIRVKTYAYTLERYQEQLNDQALQLNELEKRVKQKRIELLQQHIHQFDEQLFASDEEKWQQIGEQYQQFLSESVKRQDVFVEKAEAINEAVVNVPFKADLFQQKNELLNERVRRHREMSDEIISEEKKIMQGEK